MWADRCLLAGLGFSIVRLGTMAQNAQPLVFDIASDTVRTDHDASVWKQTWIPQVATAKSKEEAARVLEEARTEATTPARLVLWSG